MKFIITFEVPDGTMVKIDEDFPAGGRQQYVPPFEDELIPLPPEAIPVQGDPAPFRAPQPRAAPFVAMCPTHHEPWKLVPEGVSKKTGRPYSAFYACPVRGCDQRPAA